MDVRHLEIFRAVVDAGTATRAAQALGLSQPAISRNIQQLEQDLGFHLFDRARGRLSPTPEAMRLHAEIVKAFTGIEKVVSTARDIGNTAPGSLRIAVVPSLAHGLFRDVLSSFIKRMPSLSVSLEVRAQRSVVDIVTSRGADIGAATMPVIHPGITSELFCQPRSVCMLPKGHSLAKHEVIQVDMLNGVDFIFLTRRNKSRHQLDEIFLTEGVKPRLRVEVSNAPMACSLAAEGLGITVVNALIARRYDGKGVVMREMEPRISYDYGLFFPANQPRSEITQAFTAHLTEHLGQIGEGLSNQTRKRRNAT